jgi:hypothetical protein
MLKLPTTDTASTQHRVKPQHQESKSRFLGRTDRSGLKLACPSGLSSAVVGGSSFLCGRGYTISCGGESLNSYRLLVRFLSFGDSICFHRHNNLPWGLFKFSSAICRPCLFQIDHTFQPTCLPFALLSESQLPYCALLGPMLSTEQPLDLTLRVQDYKNYQVNSTKSYQQQYDAMLHPASKPTPKQVSMTFMLLREPKWFLLEDT